MLSVRTKKTWSLIIALFAFLLMPKITLASCPADSCMSQADCGLLNGALVPGPNGEGCAGQGIICCDKAKPVGPTACQAWPAPCGCEWKEPVKPDNFDYKTADEATQKILTSQGWECAGGPATPENPGGGAWGVPGPGYCCAKAKASNNGSAPAAGTPAKSPQGAMKLVTCVTDGTGNCTVEDIVKQGVYFAQFIMGLSGSLFLIVFIYGGACYLLSFGRSSWVEKGKKAMIQATIGIVLVLGAWTIVNYVATSIGYAGGGGTDASTPQTGGQSTGTGTGVDTCGTPAAKQGSAGWTCQMTTAMPSQQKAKCVSHECKSNSSNDYKCCPP